MNTKYLLFFAIPALTVLVTAKQPTASWELMVLIGSMLLQGCIGVKALQSDPNSTSQDKSNNLNGNGKHKAESVEVSVTAPVIPKP